MYTGATFYSSGQFYQDFSPVQCESSTGSGRSGSRASEGAGRELGRLVGGGEINK